MIPIRLSPFIVVSCMLLLVCNKPLPTEPAPSITTVAEMQIADNEVSGWTQADSLDTFYTMPVDTLKRLIDGPEQTYKDYGCKELAYQTLTGPDPRTFTSYTMDFTTVSKASDLFNHEKAVYGGIKSVPSFDDATVFVTSINYGIVARAHFNKFYFEITLAGFTDSAEVLETARAFIISFKEKIK